MNPLPSPAVTPLYDVQDTPDTRCIEIQRVGVKNVRYPLRWGATMTTATWDMFVHLAQEKKGTHMSRFIVLLEKNLSSAMNIAHIGKMLEEMLVLLEAQAGDISLCFPYFLRKKAPVSGVESFLDYELGVRAARAISQKTAEITLTCSIPVTSLCPCSKKISRYGAHNQRSHIRVEAVLADLSIDVDALIFSIEQQASCALFGLLKRVDEKYVTEYAYDHPKFVEDMVRDVAGLLNGMNAVAAYTLAVENFESIHNHSAYAWIQHDKRRS